ncbi:tetratricopeptide repeat-containing diguanylate cyclase [Desulfovibrio litoralis]|uniref:Pentatricopeptide repeat domain-containing protein (PPR motif) n=1 Tax=Desulfovibrio litoralis DSM 11393 TaxID=1121455 RepID=A0A1M7RQS5_9BACT|nr:tetratricopeptide repeat protein [Desulfovibrio litoralis]SHN48624.1 pentatricopeptide repeat domain-containing protein (PPR motif) [Desulfovibrio litoralis DSM 11393]
MNNQDKNEQNVGNKNNKLVDNAQDNSNANLKQTEKKENNNTFFSDLSRKDLVNFEPRLREALRNILKFEQGLLYFPRLNAIKETQYKPEYLEEEQTLLFPLYNLNNELLALFSAKGVEALFAKALLPIMPNITRLCIENLSLYKQIISDPLTGLATKEHFLATVASELELLREGLRSWALFDKENTQNKLNNAGEAKRSALLSGTTPCCFSILSVKLSNFNLLLNKYGQEFTNEMLVALAKGLEKCIGGKGLIGRSSERGFAIFLPQLMPKQAKKIALELVHCLAGVGVYNELMATQVLAEISLGLSACPQDIGNVANASFSKEKTLKTLSRAETLNYDHAKLLLFKAEQAALTADELPVSALWPPQYYSDSQTEDEGGNNSKASAHIMSYSRILYEGGKITELLPLARVKINLGHNFKVMEGMRFAVWGISSGVISSNAEVFYKGELSVISVKSDYALAELHSLTDPTFSLNVGDRLTLLQEFTPSNSLQNTHSDERDSLTGLLRYSDFINVWSEEREKHANFHLALLRLAHNSELRFNLLENDINELTDELSNQNNVVLNSDQKLAYLVELCHKKFGAKLIGGRYGLNSIIFFHTEKNTEEIASLYAEINNEFEDDLVMNSSLAVGIVPHPFLNFRSADALANCHKALEYALLLPSPQVGVLDSLALNISADKKMSMGDSFEALEEYKLAILADEDNILAWNSMAVCLAELGRTEEARRYFEEVLKRNPNELEAHYNLAQVFQKLGEIKAAQKHYEACIKLEQEHLFAYVRLGQIAEQLGANNDARNLYEQALSLVGGEAIISRQLARLCIKEEKITEARSFLYKALEHNPQDAIARYLLADLYLQGGEDPELAESQARQAIMVNPKLKQAWIVLAKALTAGGKKEQANEAMYNADLAGRN